MGQQREGEIKERQILTFVIDRIKGHVFVLKNGKLLSQDITGDQKQMKFMEVMRAAIAKQKTQKNFQRNKESHE